MTSRNYLFNSIKENIRRNFYLFILITLGFLAIFPLKTIMALDRAKAIIPMENEMNPVKMEFLNCIGMENNMATIFIGVIAVLLGIIGFCYLYSGEKTDFYHSLPLKREELFVIPFFSGFFMFFVPYLLSVGITYLIGIGYHGVSAQSGVQTIVAIGMNILFFLELYVFAILAILLTGNLFTGILAFAGFMSYGWIVYGAYHYMNNMFFDTLAQFQEPGITKYLSPIISHLDALDLWVAKTGSIRGYVIYAVILIAVVLAVDVCIYKIRPSESFHKSVAFQKLQPMIKVCAVLPISVLISLFFSAGMEHEFLWLCVSVILVSIVLSCVFEFLFTMDIRKCIRPQISTGVILAVLAVVLARYKMDILGVDEYLPEKDDVETMSVYFTSINERANYPMKYPVGADEQMERNQTKDFDAIYEMAKLGVNYYKDHDKQSVDIAPAFLRTQSTWALTEEDESVMVSVYIRYHLKNGRTVNRAYYLPESKEILALASDIYDNWDYKKTMLPTSYVSEQDIEYLYVKDIFDKRLQLNATEDVIDNIYKTYKGELESMTLEQSSKDRILGYLSVEEKIEENYNQTTDFPIYESFTKTRELLENAGQPLKELSSDDILSITCYGTRSNGEYVEEVITDKAEIEEILPSLTYEMGHYGLGSKVSYELNFNILFEDRGTQMQNNLYMMEGEAFNSLLEKLNID